MKVVWKKNSETQAAAMAFLASMEIPLVEVLAFRAIKIKAFFFLCQWEFLKKTFYFIKMEWEQGDFFIDYRTCKEV